MTPQSSEEIVGLAETVADITRQLDRTASTVVLFVDLCGSTSLKARPQSEWLPIVCRFLTEVTRVVVREGGEVVKYIGDEVMAVFKDHDGFAPARAETCVMALDALMCALGDPYQAKFVLDAGDVVEVTFPPYDILGTAIDRCARVGKIAQAGVALASEAFRDKTPHKESWMSVGSYVFKGLPAPVKLFRLGKLSGIWKAPDVELAVMSQDELFATVWDLRAKVTQQAHEVETYRDELRRLRERL